MDFKWKWSALYINLYIKIALHLKQKWSMILIVREDLERTCKCCMLESLLYFLNEVLSWMIQEHLCIIALSFLSVILLCGRYYRTGKFSAFTWTTFWKWAGCKGSWSMHKYWGSGSYGLHQCGSSIRRFFLGGGDPMFSFFVRGEERGLTCWVSSTPPPHPPHPTSFPLIQIDLALHRHAVYS